jgi:hypothetical protein
MEALTDLEAEIHTVGHCLGPPSDPDALNVVALFCASLASAI